MSCGRLIPTLVAALIVAAPVFVLAQPTDAGVAQTADAGAASTGSGSSAQPADIPDESTTVKDAAKAIGDKDWFMLAGALLAGVIHVARFLLKKKWPKWGESHYGVFLAAGMSAIAALAIAWLSGKDVATTHTALGALKLMAAAVLTYVVPQKIAQGVVPQPSDFAQKS